MRIVAQRMTGLLGELALAETVAAILHAHRTGAMTPSETVARSFARIRAHNDPAIFITLRDEAAAKIGRAHV